MKISRSSTVGAFALVGTLALSACGSDATPANNGNGGDAQTSGGTTSAASGSAQCFSGDLTAEGSSAQKNAIDAAIKAYGEKCPDANVDYNPTGSGAGIKQFIAKQVSFGGSDSALKTVEKDGHIEAADAKAACGSDALNIPMVVGPIAVAYNVQGVDKLTLNAEVTAKIFDGKITTWNDPAIAALNKDATLPATPIKVYFRSDESGTTDNFTKYLNAAAPSVWTADPGKKWTGPVGEGKQKSAGVASAVQAQNGGITYVEWSYVKQNNLKMAAIDNGSGAVELSKESVGKTVATAKQTGTGNDLALKLDYATKESGAYPIVLVTYEIVCSKYPDATTGTNVKDFLTFMSSPEVQATFEELGYAPLPTEVQTKVTAAIATIS